MPLFFSCKLWQHFSQIHTLWSKGPSLVTAALKPQHSGVFCLPIPASSGVSCSWSWLLGWAPCWRRKEAFSIRPCSTARKRGVWPRGVQQSTESGPEAGQQETVRSVSLQNKRAEDTNLSVWVPEWFGLSGRLLRGEQSNLCCPTVRTCLCAGQTDLSGASHYLESDWVVICTCIKRNKVWKTEGSEFYSEQQNSPGCRPCILPYLAL